MLKKIKSKHNRTLKKNWTNPIMKQKNKTIFTTDCHFFKNFSLNIIEWILFFKGQIQNWKFDGKLVENQMEHGVHHSWLSRANAIQRRKIN